jgi:hypothetical protein
MALSKKTIKSKEVQVVSIGSGTANSNAYLGGDGIWRSTLVEPAYTVTGISGTTATISVDFSSVNATTILVNLPSGTTGANITFTNLASKATANTVFSINVVLSHASALSSTSSVVFKHGSNVAPKWTGNIIPPSTTTANGVDIWTFFTYDAGSSLVGSLAMQDVRNA